MWRRGQPPIAGVRGLPAREGENERDQGGQRTGQALLANLADNAALADLEGLDPLLTGKTALVCSEDALAQIG